MNIIQARSVVNGLHHWPDAPERRAYLRSLHRHIFVIDVRIFVGGADREVEFHDLSENVETLVRSFGVRYHDDSLLTNFGALSCEHIAGRVAQALLAEGLSVQSVTVSEDGENSSEWRNDE